MLLLPEDLKQHEDKIYEVQQLREVQRFMLEVLQVIATHRLKESNKAQYEQIRQNSNSPQPDNMSRISESYSIGQRNPSIMVPNKPITQQ